MPKRNAPSGSALSKRRRTRGPTRGRKWSRKTTSNFLAVVRPPGGVGFPKQLKMKHRYCTTISMNSTGGALNTYKFSCNGMFDPDITGVGHQPLFFDQLTNVYNHYHVIASRITIKGTPPASTAGISSYVALVTDDDGYETYTNLASVVENGALRKNFKVTGGINPQPITMSLGWSAKKEFGKGIMANNDLQGDINNNPAEQSYFFVQLQSSDLTTTVLCNFFVEIEYIAIWNEIKQITPS